MTLDGDDRGSVESLMQTLEEEGWSVDEYNIGPWQVMYPAPGSDAVYGLDVTLHLTEP